MDGSMCWCSGIVQRDRFISCWWLLWYQIDVRTGIISLAFIWTAKFVDHGLNRGVAQFRWNYKDVIDFVCLHEDYTIIFEHYRLDLGLWWICASNEKRYNTLENACLFAFCFERHSRPHFHLFYFFDHRFFSWSRSGKLNQLSWPSENSG